MSRDVHRALDECPRLGDKNGNRPLVVLNFTIAIRSLSLDGLTRQFLSVNTGSVVLDVDSSLDSRVFRTDPAVRPVERRSQTDLRLHRNGHGSSG